MLSWLIFLIPFLPTLTIGSLPVSFVRIGVPFFILIWLIKGLIKKEIFLLISPPIIFLAGFVFLGATSILWAGNPNFAIRKEILWLSIFPLAVIFASFFLNNIENRRNKIFKSVVFSSGTLSVFAIGQFFTQFIFGHEATSSFLSKTTTPFFVGIPAAEIIKQNSSWFVNIGGETIMRAVANFPDPHTLALFLGLGFPFALLAHNYLKEKSRFFGIAAVAIFCAILLTFSRGAYIALIFSVFSLAPFLWQNSKKNIKIIVIFAIIILLLFGQPVISRFFTSFNTSEGSNAGRIIIWKDAFEVFKENPLLGVGLGNYPLTQDEFISARSPINAHNTYLEITAELGLVGLFLWLGMLGSSILILYNSAIKRKEIISIAAFGSLIFFIVHSFFETVIYSPQNLVVLSLILAIAAKEDSLTRNLDTRYLDT